MRNLRHSTLKKDKKSKVKCPVHSGALFVSWNDEDGKKVWEGIKELCHKANWELEAKNKPKKGPGGYSQKIIFTVNKKLEG